MTGFAKRFRRTGNQSPAGSGLSGVGSRRGAEARAAASPTDPSESGVPEVDQELDQAGPALIPVRTADEEFASFVHRYGRGLGRLAYLLLGDADAAEDLTSDVFLAAWRQWERVQSVDYPLAYLRQVMVNLASTKIARLARERRGLERLQRHEAAQASYEPDGAISVDVRAALLRLPPGRRACLVLRYAFDLPEREVAEALGVSVGTVKSQTSKAVDQFRRELGATVADGRAKARTSTGVRR